MSESNRVTPEGKALGEQLARLCEKEIPKLIEEEEWHHDERCASCAFRLGTVPNGCPQTVMDALKCVMEKEPFFCHMTPMLGERVCEGWFASVQALKAAPKAVCPWPYSEPDPA